MSAGVVDRILFVCTANECRSPFAEAIATRAARGRPVEFSSAGVDAWRRGVPATGIALARELGLDVESHISRSVLVDALGDYDLVLALSRVHARELLAMDPALRPRLFTLKQFARWISETPRPQSVVLGEWLDAVAAQRPPAEFLGRSVADDVDDPLGLPLAEWRRMSEELTTAIDAVIRGLYPEPRLRRDRRRPDSN